VELIRDGNGFDGYGRDEDGFDKLGFNEHGVNRTGQFLSDVPPEFLEELKMELLYYESNNLPWNAPPTLDLDMCRDAYADWYAAREGRFPEETQVGNTRSKSVYLTTLCLRVTEFGYKIRYQVLRWPRDRE
jgi:hypothetical protein